MKQKKTTEELRTDELRNAIEVLRRDLTRARCPEENTILREKLNDLAAHMIHAMTGDHAHGDNIAPYCLSSISHSRNDRQMNRRDILNGSGKKEQSLMADSCLTARIHALTHHSFLKKGSFLKD